MGYEGTKLGLPYPSPNHVPAPLPTAVLWQQKSIRSAGHETNKYANIGKTVSIFDRDICPENGVGLLTYCCCLICQNENYSQRKGKAGSWPPEWKGMAHMLEIIRSAFT